MPSKQVLHITRMYKSSDPKYTFFSGKMFCIYYQWYETKLNVSGNYKDKNIYTKSRVVIARSKWKTSLDNLGTMN